MFKNKIAKRFSLNCSKCEMHVSISSICQHIFPPKRNYMYTYIYRSVSPNNKTKTNKKMLSKIKPVVLMSFLLLFPLCSSGKSICIFVYGLSCLNI